MICWEFSTIPQFAQLTGGRVSRGVALAKCGEAPESIVQLRQFPEPFPVAIIPNTFIHTCNFKAPASARMRLY